MASTDNQHRQNYAAKIASRLSLIPFLKMPTVADARLNRHAWYAFVMQFEPEKAPQGLSREDFDQRLEKRGLKEVDIPRSTGLLNEMPLFTHFHEAIPRFGSESWHDKQPTEDFPVANKFFQQSIKLPIWTTDKDKLIVEHYIQTFLDVAEEVISDRLLDTREESQFSEVKHRQIQARL